MSEEADVVAAGGSLGGPTGALIASGLLLLDFGYHRLFDKPPPPPPKDTIVLPRTKDGTPIPLLFGRCRVRQPILVWNGLPFATNISGDDYAPLRATIGEGYTYLYAMRMMLVLGVGFDGGLAHLGDTMWAGDLALNGSTAIGAALNQLTGTTPLTDANGVVNTLRCYVGWRKPGGIIGGGCVEVLNGNSTQQLLDNATGDAKSVAGFWMKQYGLSAVPPITADEIPSYRGYLSVMLYGSGPYGQLDGTTTNSVTGDFGGWTIGVTGTPPAYNFEAACYPASSLSVQPGYECNPVDVLYALLKDKFGKLGLDVSLIDTTSFAAAGITLYIEDNGYSRAIEVEIGAEEAIQDVLRQIDGILYVDPSDGKYHLKLVRQDYDPAACLEVNTNNCEELQVTVTGWGGLANQVIVTFPNRTQFYQDDTVTAQNQANAVGQNGEVVLINLSIPGCATPTNATAIATRELAARSRPLARCTAIITEGFTTTVPGDVVAVTWGDYGWSGLLFRVAGVSRGTLADGRIKLQLIQEYFQVSRGAHLPPGIGSFPHTSVG